MPPPLHAVMEHLWSRADATDVNRRQGCSRAKRPGCLQTAAIGCIPLPPTLDGKEGVDGSSPSEGFEKTSAQGVFSSTASGASAAGYPPRLAQLVRTLRARRLGHRYPTISTDFFQAGDGIWQTAGGDAATGVYVSIFGIPNTELPSVGQHFLHSFWSTTPSWGATYAAEATEVLLDAITRSDGTRNSVLQQLRATAIADGIVGPLRFDHDGDVVDGPITILPLRRRGHSIADPGFANTVVDRVITPPAPIVP